MAGASIRITLDDQQAREVLARLRHAGADLERPLRDVGEQLLQSTRERFRTETAPDGTPWAPLSARYQRRKRRNADKILTLRGYLSGPRLSYRVRADTLEVGTSAVYGATHQFGRGAIPARPFLGFSRADQDAIADTLLQHLSQSLGH